LTTHLPTTRAIDVGDLLIEISPQPYVVVPGAQREGMAGNRAVDLADRLEEVGDKIGTVCTTLYTKALDAIQGVKPDEFEIEFGMTLAGEIGIPMVSKGSAECEFKVTAKWNLTPEPPPSNAQTPAATNG
jgi:Trypsin-co-occurring domain 1